MQNYFVIRGDVCHLFSVKQAFTASLTPMMQPHVLDDCSDNLVVLLLRRPEIRPGQVLQLRHDARAYNLATRVFLRQLKPSLDQIRHQTFNRDEENLLVVVKRDACVYLRRRPVA